MKTLATSPRFIATGAIQSAATTPRTLLLAHAVATGGAA